MTKKQIDKFVEPFIFMFDTYKQQVIENKRDVIMYRYDYEVATASLSNIFDNLFMTDKISKNTYNYCYEILNNIMLTYEM